jgi:rhodanese-related sulfurtransferase
MERLVVIESINNAMDMGIFREVIQNSLKTRFEMGPKEFLKHLMFGIGYDELTPPQLSRKLENPEQKPLIIDLRDNYKFKEGHISGAVLHPFEDLLRDVLMDDRYLAYKNSPIVLVCDTGHQSRVAASVLTDEGFLKISSLKRGMRRWNRWKKLVSNCRQSKNKSFYICHYFFNS